MRETSIRPQTAFHDSEAPFLAWNDDDGETNEDIDKQYYSV